MQKIEYNILIKHLMLLVLKFKDNTNYLHIATSI